jgi:hypothetical protein
VEVSLYGKQRRRVGPIDVVVIRVPTECTENRGSGPSPPRPRRPRRPRDHPRARRTVRAKDPDGTFSGFDLADLDQDTAGDFTVFSGAATGMLNDDDDAAVAAAEIEPGSAAVLIVYENRWAARFISAVRRNGGELIASERIGVQQLIDALDATEKPA